MFGFPHQMDKILKPFHNFRLLNFSLSYRHLPDEDLNKIRDRVPGPLTKQWTLTFLKATAIYLLVEISHT